MTPSQMRPVVALLLAAVAVAGCGGPGRSVRAADASPQPVARRPADLSPAEKARADSARYPYTKADIDFMSGMISHHAQAIMMAGMAATHEASPTIRTLAERIINAQQDEILIIQQWLRDRGQSVPEPSPKGMKMVHNGVEHVMMMPGMLTEAQVAELDRARGPEFDRLFLKFMIQHHRGAVSMVKDLFNTYGAGQDETVFKFASDVNVDQSTEIARMERMLITLTLEKRAP